MVNFEKSEYYKSKKKDGSVSINQNKMRRYARDLKNIADLYNIIISNQVVIQVKKVKH